MSEERDDAEHTRDLKLGSRARLRSFVLLALTIAGLYVCFRLLLPFLAALVWALALAVLFVPAHRWAEARLNNDNIAATLSVLLIGLLVVGPVLLVSSMVVDAAAGGAVAFQERLASGEWRRVFENEELLAPVSRWTAQIDLQGASKAVTSWLTTMSASFVTGSILGVITLLATFYLLFYFLRDRAAALD